MIATVVPVDGLRVWRVDGQAGTITDLGVTGGSLFVALDGDPLPVPLVTQAWRPALTCEYCDRPAQVQVRDGQPHDVLCRDCACDHYERPADWVRPIPRTLIRFTLFEQCRELEVGDPA